MVLASLGFSSASEQWLLENGPKELEHLFRAIVFHPATPVLITDDERTSVEVSMGVGKLLGLSREKIIGLKLDDLAAPEIKPAIPQLWNAFLQEGEHEGELMLTRTNGEPLPVIYKAKKNILPVRHVVVLHTKTDTARESIPAWVQDYALFLLDSEGCIAAWYGGAERIYGFTAEEAIGQPSSFLYSDTTALAANLQDELRRAATAGHFGAEGWQVKKDGSRFWANNITMALRTEDGGLQGYARVVRDFTGRHENDEKLRRESSRLLPIPVRPSIVAVVSGEFDRIPEVNDAFLTLTGYGRDDLRMGLVQWAALTPPEYGALDELAHEEGLCFGACAPYEKELIRKDGTRVPVLVATAVLKLSPFRWISFIEDLGERRDNAVDEPEALHRKGFEEIVGTSAPIHRVQELVEMVAPTDATVLIMGETGTGKELVARAVHRMSPRRQMPFITLNCAAIPTGLLESELFGYERGAFTGALTQKIGRFEMAHRGTLFLDEVGDIPLDLQPKLLRALQEKSFERLGGTKTIPIDVRLVAATNRNLTQMMGDKLFRSDLYYRLKVFPVTTPPLRDRPDDIPLLARFFTKKYAQKMGRKIDQIPLETMRALTSWHWPGNIRELENFIERSVILSRGPALRAPLSEIRKDALALEGTITLEHVEREHILRVLRDSGGVVTTAATRLGLHRTTLNAVMRKLGISRADL